MRAPTGTTQFESSMRRKACLRCREQKVRCDAFETNPKPCTRCREADEVCKAVPVHQGSTDRSTRKIASRPSNILSRPTSKSSHLATSSATCKLNQQYETPQFQPSMTVFLNSNRDNVSNDIPNSRDLGGLFFEGHTVKYLFQRYFDDFSPVIPILESTKTADKYFERSPLLFWSIATVGARRSSLPQDVIVELSKRTISLALTFVTKSQIHIIESFLILLTWWLPSMKSLIESPAVLAGCLLHSAMHMGLHNPVRSQDFDRLKLELSKEDIAHRAELWAHTVILYQKYWSTSGISEDMFGNIGSDARWLTGDLPGSLRFQRSLFNQVTAVLKMLAKESQLAEDGMLPVKTDSMIKLGDSQLHTLRPDEAFCTAADELHWLMCRLLIYSHHLHQPLQHPNEITLELHEICCSVIRHMHSLEKNEVNFMSLGTVFVLHVSKIATSTLMHLTLRPSLQSLVQGSEASQLIEVGLRHQQKLGFGNHFGDWAQTMSSMFASLRLNENVIRDENGEVTFELRIKSRGPMSVVHDFAWWVRQNGGLPITYVGKQPKYMQVIHEIHHSTSRTAEDLTIPVAKINDEASQKSTKVINGSLASTVKPAQTTRNLEDNSGWNSQILDPTRDLQASLNDIDLPTIDWDLFDDLFFDTV